MPPEIESLIQDLRERVERSEAQLAAAVREIERKDQIIAALQHRLFGSKSERIDPDQYQLDFGEEVMGKPEAAPPTPAGGEGGPEAEDADARPRARRCKDDLFPRNLPVVIEEVIVPAEVEASPDDFVEIGEEHHDEIEAVKASLYWRRKVRKKYKRKGQRELPPVIAPAPEPSIPGTMCGPRLMATILTDKYADHLPHYRQAGRFLRRHGVELSRQKLNLWTHAAAAHLAPVNAAILAELRGASVLQIDETPGDYLAPGTGKVGQGFFWVYRDAVTGTIYCDWRLGRGHDCMLEILGLDEETGVARFSGAIQCDGFIAYQTLVSRYAGIRLAGCLTHVRRKFYDARKQSPEAAMPILQLIARIYRVEEWARQTKAPPDCRLLVRRGHAVPHLAELKEALLAARDKHYPSSLMGEAIGYALNRWEEIEHCFEDGRLEIDNNLVENAIRPVKLGLKNYLFFGNAEAGKTSALFYTLLGNCKALGIDYERYLEVVLDRVTSKTTPEEAAKLTPAKLAEEIRAQQPVPSGTAAVVRAA